VQLARKDVVAARAAFESSLAADPKFGAAALNLARLDLAEGKTGDARKRLESSLAAEPTNQGVLLALAQLELAAGAADKAIEHLESAREADASALAPRVVLARVALARGDLTTAEAASAEAEALRGDAVDVLLVRAQLMAASGNRAELSRYLDALESQLAKAPTNANAMRLQVGELQRQAGRVAQARANLTMALSEPASETPALASLVQLETAAGELDAARAYLARLREKKIDAAIVEELDGDLAVRSADLDAAAMHYAKAAKANSRSAVTKLAMVQGRQGKASVGIATLESWLGANPNDDAVALLLASMRIGTGDAAQARADYEALLPRHGNNPVLLNNLAWLYFDAKDARAEETARRAHAAAPDNADVADTLGWILVHSDAPGAASEGLVLLEKAAARRDAPSVLYHLAVAQEKAGRTRDARATVARALATERFAERAQAEELARRLEEG
jgi:putative PEP-CTERM system TPR-repeat lipoprotein